MPKVIALYPTLKLVPHGLNKFKKLDADNSNRIVAPRPLRFYRMIHISKKKSFFFLSFPLLPVAREAQKRRWNSHVEKLGLKTYFFDARA